MFLWFNQPASLPQLLDAWGQPAFNYDPNQPTDASWKVDIYEMPLPEPPDPQGFDRLSERLFRYEFYPPGVLTHASDASLASRPLRTGDRIIQRIRVIPGILDYVSLNVVSAVVYEARRRGFTCRTTARHLEQGEWSAFVIRRKSGEAALLVQSVSKARLPFFMRPYARLLQKRAHRLGIAHFIANLPWRPPAQGSG
jgi:uncharacterized protein (UPF0548 family)